MFATILALFALPFVFWGVLVASFFAIALSIDWAESSDKHNYGWSWLLATLGSGGLALTAASHFGITVDTILATPMTAVYGVAAYFVVGTLWSFAKWYFHLSNIRDAYVEIKERFIQENKLPVDFLKDTLSFDPKNTTSEETAAVEKQQKLNRTFFSAVVARMRVYQAPSLEHHGESYTSSHAAALDTAQVVQAIKPLAMHHKSRITQWIAFWPVSGVWTIINDPVRKIVNYIFSRIKSIFQRMSDAMFAGV